jgi:hypothetical protein
MDGRKLAGIVFMLAVGGLIGWLRFSSRADERAAVEAQRDTFRTQVLERVRSQDWYAKHATILDKNLDMADQAADGVAYSLGTRGRAGTFDKNKYVAAFFKFLEPVAQSRGLKDLDFGLRDLQVRIENALAKGEDW